MNTVEKLAAVNAMRQGLAQAEDQLKHETIELSHTTGGTTFKPAMGRVNVVRREPAPVIDADAFLAWVEANRPDEVVTRREVRESFAKALKDKLVVDGEDVILPSGEIAPFASVSEPSEYVAVKLDPAIKARSAVLIAGRLDAVLAAGALGVAS